MKQNLHIATLLALAFVSAGLGDPEEIGQVVLKKGDFIEIYDRDNLLANNKDVVAKLKTAIKVGENNYLIGLNQIDTSVELHDDQFKGVAKLLYNEDVEQLAGEYGDGGQVQFAVVRVDAEGAWTVDRKFTNIVDFAKLSDKNDEIWAATTSGTIHKLENTEEGYKLGERIIKDFGLPGLKSIMRPSSTEDGTTVEIGFNTEDGGFYPFEVVRNGEDISLVAMKAEFDLASGSEVYAKAGSAYVIKDSAGNFYNDTLVQAQQATAA